MVGHFGEIPSPCLKLSDLSKTTPYNKQSPSLPSRDFLGKDVATLTRQNPMFQQQFMKVQRISEVPFCWFYFSRRQSDVHLQPNPPNIWKHKIKSLSNKALVSACCQSSGLKAWQESQRVEGWIAQWSGWLCRTSCIIPTATALKSTVSIHIHSIGTSWNFCKACLYQCKIYCMHEYIAWKTPIGNQLPRLMSPWFSVSFTLLICLLCVLFHVYLHSPEGSI